ncbi:hypothetical protein [Oecophyllibacter saccharovorans]|uniref:Uncharacterized protein n=1 Tax=Oecophyllibacter saccharovorans TaxID=2558360 RepID=A0A506ULN9_9PROT|nr:hypothetical protein [Oecophyllibacter saccharovorans]TPW34271.1 hypothetical protein E3202_07125 [Oecophyllibacter saccharovorans]
MPSRGQRFASGWVASPTLQTLDPAQLGQFSSLIAYGLPQEATAYGVALQERATAEPPPSVNVFEALSAFLTVPELDIEARPATPAEMQEMLLCTRPEPVWVFPADTHNSHDAGKPVSEQSLGDLMTTGRLVESFLRNLLKAQAEAPTAEACGEECAACCEEMARIFNGSAPQETGYRPLKDWHGATLAAAMTDNAFLTVPAQPDPQATMTVFFMAAGLQALELFQAHEQGTLSDQAFQDRLDGLRKTLTLFLCNRLSGQQGESP